MTRRAQIRTEFDRLKWRKARVDERLDQLAKEIETLDAEITVAGLTADLTEIHTLPTFMHLEMAADV